MSTLKVNTIQNTSAAHSSTPEQIAQGRAKAWINFNGTGTIAIRDSFNVSSITDNNTGEYTVNFQNAFADTNYCAVASASQELNATSMPDGVNVHTYTTTSVDLECFARLDGTAEGDLQIVNLIITN